MTSRGAWLLFVLLVMATLGVLSAARTGPTLALIGLIGLTWLVSSWLHFILRVQFDLPRVKIKREFYDGKNLARSFFPERTYEVHLKILLPEKGYLGYVAIRDILPLNCHIQGNSDYFGALQGGVIQTISYHLTTQGVGEIRFEGVEVRYADACGFFYRRKVIRNLSSMAVFPVPLPTKSAGRTTKRHNIYPPPGVHRLRLPGGGGELLDLRDYQSGDPPKLIAWKASARRDKLITKEFEGEVPLRTTIYIDASELTRFQNGPQTTLTHFVNLTAAICEAAASDRDRIGVTVCSEEGLTILPPARTRRHRVDILKLLAQTNARSVPIGEPVDPEEVLLQAYQLVWDVYPDYLDPAINSTPFRLFWKPLRESAWRWLRRLFMIPPVIIIGTPLFAIFALCAGFNSIFAELFTQIVTTVRSFGFRPLLITAGIGFWLGYLVWLIYGLTGWINRSAKIREKQLALVLAEYHREPLGSEITYLIDRPKLVRRACRFLAEHRVPYRVKAISGTGALAFSGQAIMERMSKALTKAITHGRDNELFILLVDLLSYESPPPELIQAIRVATARHHRVLVLVAWPEGIPVPSNQLEVDETIGVPKAARATQQGLRALVEEINQETVEITHQRFARLRRVLGRVGATVIRADANEALPLIVNRLMRLRQGR